ncbi:tetratricopeptide repeat protein [Lysobacter sp. A6]|uniref:Tetratricopeptide repeat protein n=1 Tax=Noviluteimonas lactosilytica TaxID=2888523 RepID=A0ABS8JLU1_9GAMM|nr:tetratricopeptide repeat protein [Lysobacter lactosilyticus]MCC8364579.1 tetratricopeptide repeat protein [Lysobacter lactosilyticus]
MPIIALSILLQLACAVHAVRTGRNLFWIIIIVIGSFFGVAVYLLAEVLPDHLGGPTARRASRAARGLRDKVDPERHKRHAARELDISDTIDNRRRLAEHSMASGDHQQALELYRKSLNGMYATDPVLMLGMAQAQFALEMPGEARATLDALIAANPTFRSSEGHLLYARAVDACGDVDRAISEYEALVPSFTGEEGRVRFAQLLQRRGDHARAAALFNETIKRASLAPKHYQREQREWIDIAKRAVQEPA